MKRLILCCDGTWNTADQEHEGKPCPTNVVKMACRIAKRDGGIPQIIYYDHGVGTGNFFDRLSGGLRGEGLEENIHDAYRFLLANYEWDDEILFFGFSRGAFTVRSIGGMIRKCGILRRDRVDQYRAALDLYRKGNIGPDDDQARTFRAEYSVGGKEPVPIKCMGVWDTVGALGIPIGKLASLTARKYQFHDTELSGTVEHAYHALAIDEHRAPFQPTLWDYVPKPGQTVEQVWFCGAHSDVGGGYSESQLSDISLDWMMSKVKAFLHFDEASISAFSLRADPMGVIHKSKKWVLPPGIDREIGLATHDPTQSVHETVWQRWEQDSNYRPSSLTVYFEKNRKHASHDKEELRGRTSASLDNSYRVLVDDGIRRSQDC